jgi:hypothetical protein
VSLPAKTILLRCVDPRFEGEWAISIQQAIGPHYSLTVLGGVDVLGEQGLNVLRQEIQILLVLDPSIERIVDTFHETCAWCGSRDMSENDQLRHARDLQGKLLEGIFLKMEIAKVSLAGEVIFV